MLLTAPPTSNHTQLLSILVEDRVIRGPRPLPAALRRRTLRGHMTPQGYEHLESEAPQPLEPGAFGQGPEQPGGPVFVPAPDATQLRGGATAKEGGKHDPDDFYYFVSFDLHEVSFEKKGGYPWIYTPVQPRCPSWTSFWPPSRCASVARRGRPPWSST